MDQTQERRGLFDGIRVPFDLNMMLLALAAVAGFYGAMKVVDAIAPDSQGDILQGLTNLVLFRGLPPWSILTWIVVGTIAIGFWTFFSTAISRIAAMKIAKEETIEIKDAARFAVRKFVPVASSVLFVLVIVGVFYGLLNASIAGGIGRIPWFGDIVVPLLFFLVLLSTFFFTFAAALGLVSFNLVSSAIATESSDTWDGISRAWNYVLVRPWHVLLIYALIGGYLTVFGFFGGKFLDWSVDSLSIGWWGMGEEPSVEEVRGPDLPPELRKHYEPQKGASEAEFKAWNEKKFYIALPGKETFIRMRANGQARWNEVRYVPTGADAEYLRSEYKDRRIENLPPKELEALAALEAGPNIADAIPGRWKFAASVIWLWIGLAKFLIAAYMVSYFFAGTTALYFLLRKEVEGEEYTEIVVEEEEAEEEAAWEQKAPSPEAPKPAGGAGLLQLGKIPAANAGTGAPAAGPAHAPPKAGEAPKPASAPPAATPTGAGAGPSAPGGISGGSSASTSPGAGGDAKSGETKPAEAPKPSDSGATEASKPAEPASSSTTPKA